MNLGKIIKEEINDFGDLNWINGISDKWEPRIGDKFICKPGFNKKIWSDYYGGAAYEAGKVYTIYRITPDLDNNDYTIAKFQKNHEFIKHRFNRNYEKHPFEANKQFFSIVKLEEYYYFFLNRFDRPEYMTHVSQMRMEGDRFGFYVEPGIIMRCDKIVVKRLITDKNFKGNPWMPLGDDEMPLGSEILRG